MANLIIKSSADNLVLQGSDASPAITVGATGTTTFAENATLSGTANNLGTVTAGSIAGGSITSATTFPAGHVLQILSTMGGQTDLTTTNTSVSASTAAVLSRSVTTKRINSVFLVAGTMFSHMNPNSDNKGCNGELWRIISGGTDTLIDIISNSHFHEYSSIASHNSWSTAWSYSYSPSLAAGTALELGIKIYTHDSGSTGYFHYNNASAKPVLTITEIAV